MKLSFGLEVPKKGFSLSFDSIELRLEDDWKSELNPNGAGGVGSGTRSDPAGTVNAGCFPLASDSVSVNFGGFGKSILPVVRGEQAVPLFSHKQLPAHKHILV